MSRRRLNTFEKSTNCGKAVEVPEIKVPKMLDLKSWVENVRRKRFSVYKVKIKTKTSPCVPNT